MNKPDLVIAAIGKYAWEQIRPFAISLRRSGFHGDVVLFADQIDPFATECLENRGFEVIPFVADTKTKWEFLTKGRFKPALQFLAQHRHKYRYALWVDAGDQIFQSDPSVWLESHVHSPALVAARECWLIRNEMQFNDPWVKETCPEDYKWLRNQEVCCAGTIAGDAETLFVTLCQIYKRICASPTPWAGNDQAALNYLVHKPFAFPIPTRIYVPTMAEGWTATCSAFRIGTFNSLLGHPAESLLLTDEPPIFDKEKKLVLTPDGKTPFVLVHQYNRDPAWAQIMTDTYKWG